MQHAAPPWRGGTPRPEPDIGLLKELAQQLRVDAIRATSATPSRTRLRIGGSRDVASSPDDQVAIVAAGASVDEAVRAAELLAAEGISASVLDAYSVKPLDVDAVAATATAVAGRVVVVEDHRPEGGLGSAVAEAMAGLGRPLHLVHLAVRGIPGSAPPAEGRAAAGIDSAAIVRAAMRLAGAAGGT